MSASLNARLRALPAQLLKHVDEVCDRFEAAWQTAGAASDRPQIEDYLVSAAAAEGPALAQQLVLVDIDQRRRAGENPHAGDYQARFAALDPTWLAGAVAAPALPATDPSPTPLKRVAQEPAPAASATGSPLRRLRCPHCHNPLQLADDAADEVLCPGCGSSFRVREAQSTTTTAGMRQLGKFELLERVGLGGFGAVWKARDTQLDRVVALKIPHAGLLAEPDDLERFHREARAAAQLRHPGIVTVHEVVMLEGLPALVSDFIEGVPLKELLQTRRLTFRETAGLIAEVAEASDYAHAMGLVHRDIKPANIMLDYGRSAAASACAGGAGLGIGRPLVMDFGLALRVDAEVTLTQEGHILGTPAYMSPEQAAGKGHKADRRSDVYSLGVVLYELLTGELPFRGSKAMLLLQVLREEPRPPRKVNNHIPRDLETICLKALAKEPGRRYATARELADELRRWLNGEPIQARPVSTWERTWRWVKRRPAVAALLLVSGVASLMVVGGTVGLWYHGRLQEEFGKTQEAKGQAETALEQARQAQKQVELLQYAHYIDRAHAGLRDGNLGRMEALLDACPVEQRHWEWHYLKRQCHAELLTLPGLGPGVAFSPDGTRLAAGTQDGMVKILDATSGREFLALKGHTDRVRGVAFSPDGTRLATASADHTVRLWNAKSGGLLHKLEGHTRGIHDVAFSPDGKRLASASWWDPSVRIWDVTTGLLIFEPLQGPTESRQFTSGPVYRVAFSPDGTRLATARGDGTVQVGDVTTGQLALTLKGHTWEVWAVAFSPDGRRLASASLDHTVKVWDAMTGQEVLTFKGHTNLVYCVAFSPDGSRLASAGVDGIIKVWDATTGQEALTLPGPAGAVRRVAFSPDGTRLAAASSDGTIVQVWDATTDPEARILTPDAGTSSGLALSPDGNRVALGSRSGPDDTVRVLDLTTGQLVVSLKGHTRHLVHGMAFSPDGRWLASVGGELRFWDATTGQEVPRFEGRTGAGFRVAFSPDGRRLASGSGGEVRVWDVTTGRVALTLKGHDIGIWGLAFSPDGTRLASAGEDRTVRVWDAATGEPLHTLEGHTWRVTYVAFSPDGKQLASSSYDQTVRVWDVAAGKLLRTLRGHTFFVERVVFSPDGKRLASVGRDGFVKIWDPTTDQEALLTLRFHTREFPAVAFSPDGTQLVLNTGGGTVKIFDARPVTGETPVEREALGLLDCLFTRPLCQADIVEYLKNSPTITPQARQRALELVGRYRAETDPERYHQASWAVVRQPYLNAFQYRFALRQTETACRLFPGQGKYLTALGMAQYRAGQDRGALATLAQADLLHQAAPASLASLAVQFPQALVPLRQIPPLAQAVAANLAFLAMTQHRLGHTEQAQATLARLRETMRKLERIHNGEAQAFLREAETLTGGKPALPQE